MEGTNHNPFSPTNPMDFFAIFNNQLTPESMNLDEPQEQTNLPSSPISPENLTPTSPLSPFYTDLTSQRSLSSSSPLSLPETDFTNSVSTAYNTFNFINTHDNPFALAELYTSEIVKEIKPRFKQIAAEEITKAYTFGLTIIRNLQPLPNQLVTDPFKLTPYLQNETGVSFTIFLNKQERIIYLTIPLVVQKGSQRVFERAVKIIVAPNSRPLVSYKGQLTRSLGVPTDEATPTDRQAIMKEHNKAFLEKDLLISMRSVPNVNQIEGWAEYFVQGRKKFVLMMELFKEDLFNFIQRPESYSIKDRAKILIDVLNGVMGMHAKGVVHRDIKHENCLINYTLDPKTKKVTNIAVDVADLGHACLVADIATNIPFGTPEFLAPEALGVIYNLSPNNAHHLNKDIDKWAVGCFAFNLFFNVDPLWYNSIQNVKNTYSKIIQLNWSKSDIQKLFDQGNYTKLGDLEKICAQIDEQKRQLQIHISSASNLMQLVPNVIHHPIPEINFIIKSLLKWTPHERMELSVAHNNLKAFLDRVSYSRKFVDDNFPDPYEKMTQQINQIQQPAMIPNVGFPGQSQPFTSPFPAAPTQNPFAQPQNFPMTQQNPQRQFTNINPFFVNQSTGMPQNPYAQRQGFPVSQQQHTKMTQQINQNQQPAMASNIGFPGQSQPPASPFPAASTQDPFAQPQNFSMTQQNPQRQFTHVNPFFVNQSTGIPQNPYAQPQGFPTSQQFVQSQYPQQRVNTNPQLTSHYNFTRINFIPSQNTSGNSNSRIPQNPLVQPRVNPTQQQFSQRQTTPTNLNISQNLFNNQNPEISQDLLLQLHGFSTSQPIEQDPFDSQLSQWNSSIFSNVNTPQQHPQNNPYPTQFQPMSTQQHQAPQFASPPQNPSQNRFASPVNIPQMQPNILTMNTPYAPEMNAYRLSNPPFSPQQSQQNPIDLPPEIYAELFPTLQPEPSRDPKKN